MGLFDFFRRPKKQPTETQEISTEDEIYEVVEQEIQQPVEDFVESEIVESDQEVDEVVISENEVDEIISEEITEKLVEEYKEIDDWIPMDEVMDKLKSKYKTYESQTYDLSTFLDYDYATEGQKDGYHIHTSEYLKKKKNSLIAEFQRLIEKRVDELKDERLNCKNIVIDMRSISDQLVDKFELRINLCNEYIDDLHKEKELSNGGQGLIRSVLWDYECGWDKGISDYLQDNYFLNPLKRL